MRRYAVGVALVVAIALATLMDHHMRFVWHPQRQELRTCADMQIEVAQIEKRRGELGRTLSVREAEEILKKDFGDRDVWKRRLRYIVGGPGGNHYVLVSLGSDGIQDMPDEAYFSLPEGPVPDRPGADLVFRDGQWIRCRGK